VRLSVSTAPGAGGGDGETGSVWSGARARTRQTRRAETRARITLLAYSVAVRSGIIRNAE